MVDGLNEIKTREEFTRFLCNHTLKNEPYDDESKAYILELCRNFGLSQNVLRMHYDIPKKDTTSR